MNLSKTPAPFVTQVTRTLARMTTIEDRIKEQGDVVRKLKAEKAAKEKIDEEVTKLKALKAELAQASRPAPNPELEARIKEQGDVVRKLKSDKAPKEEIDGAVEKLKALKLQLQPGGGEAQAGVNMFVDENKRKTSAF